MRSHPRPQRRRGPRRRDHVRRTHRRAPRGRRLRLASLSQLSRPVSLHRSVAHAPPAAPSRRRPARSRWRPEQVLRRPVPNRLPLARLFVPALALPDLPPPPQAVSDSSTQQFRRHRDYSWRRLRSGQSDSDQPGCCPARPHRRAGKTTRPHRRTADRSGRIRRPLFSTTPTSSASPGQPVPRRCATCPIPSHRQTLRGPSSPSPTTVRLPDRHSTTRLEDAAQRQPGASQPNAART